MQPSMGKILYVYRLRKDFTFKYLEQLPYYNI